MIGFSVLLAANVIIAVACVSLVVLVAVIKLVRAAADSSRTARLAPYRSSLLAIAAGSDEGTAAADGLLIMPERDWRVVRDLVVTLLGKVRGDSRDVLVGLLAAHGEFSRARAAVGSRRAVRRANAVYLLGLAGRGEDAGLLVPLLADHSAEVRLIAARSLGSMGDPAAGDALFDALGLVRGHPGIPATAAAEALLSFGTGAVPAVLRALAADDVTMRAVAAMVVAEGMLTAAAWPLRHLLSEDPALEVRIFAARALGVMGGAEDVAGLIAQTTQAQPPALRQAAVQALGELGDRDAVPALAALLADPDARLAQHSGDALVRLGPAGLHALEQAGDGTTQAARVAAGSLAIARLRHQLPQPAGAPLPGGSGSLQ